MINGPCLRKVSSINDESMDILAPVTVNPRALSRSSLEPVVPGTHALLESIPPANSPMLRVVFVLNETTIATHAIQQIGLSPWGISGTENEIWPIGAFSLRLGIVYLGLRFLGSTVSSILKKRPLLLRQRWK